MQTYEVLYAGDFVELAKLVNEALVHNATLVGGVGSYQVPDRDAYGNTFVYTYFMQAITRKP